MAAASAERSCRNVSSWAWSARGRGNDGSGDGPEGVDLRLELVSRPRAAALGALPAGISKITRKRSMTSPRLRVSRSSMRAASMRSSGIPLGAAAERHCRQSSDAKSR